MSDPRRRFALDLDSPFQRRLKVMAALRGVTMRQYCLGAIDKELAMDEVKGAKALPFGEEALQRLAELQPEVFQSRRLPSDSTELIRVPPLHDCHSR